jgi:oligosaccharide repeat unit polymerase
LNIVVSYSFQRNILAPPIAINGGFVVATYMAILYSNEWDLDQMNYSTFKVLAVGCILFTIVSIIYTKAHTIPKRKVKNENFREVFEMRRLCRLLLICAVLQTIVAYLKIHYYSIVFGNNLSLNELLFASRLNFFDSDKIEVFPFWFRNVMQLFTAAALIWYYLFSRAILSKGKNLKVKLLLLLNIILQMVSSLFDGARGGVMSSIVLFAVIFILKYFQYRGKMTLNLKYIIKFIVLAVILGSLMKISSQFVGRTSNNNNSTDGDVSSLYYFAYYCGGEIKNLDIYMDHPKQSETFGEATLSSLYSSIGKYIGVKSEVVDLPFNTYKGLPLGNVYTIFYNFYMDDRFIGVIIFTIIMAIISSATFVKTQQVLKSRQTISEVMYAQMYFSLIMSFFANRFYNEVICVPFLKNLLYWYILSFLIIHYIKKPKPIWEKSLQ